MPTERTIYICVQCTNQVRPPGHMGRSWCPKCELYLVPLPTDPETMEQPEEGRDLHRYRFNTWRPRGVRYAADEVPEHRFMYVKRTDILVKGAKGISFLPKCTCGKWKHQHGFTTKARAHRLWDTHMAEVAKQGTLNVG